MVWGGEKSQQSIVQAYSIMILKRRTILSSSVVLLAILSLFTSVVMWSELHRPIPIQKQQNIIQVHKNTSAKELLQDMHTKRWIRSVRFWTWYLKIHKLSATLKAGIYQIQPQESVQHLLQRIASGDVLRERFLILPGTTVTQISKNLNEAPYINYQASDWNTIMEQYDSAEGLLLADTYLYEAGSSAKQLFTQAHEQLQRILMQIWNTRHSNLPYQRPYDLLIVASILEKEAAIPEERRLISGVIINRLRQHMPLQMDPTVIYALGDQYQGALTHEQMSIPSPYNTYLHQGLPPTPIAMVSRDAIDAAGHPIMHSYLYFLAKGDGTHIFTTNYQEHCEAIKRYMRKPI
ncbi:MAG TPA: endolytic transglycosylase MltG [Legionellaceae bacterium]|nr:endolytic transglycosylase MltG [Legionellaceae bacterium]